MKKNITGRRHVHAVHAGNKEPVVRLLLSGCFFSFAHMSVQHGDLGGAERPLRLALDTLSEAEIMQWNIPTGVPLVYE